MLLWFVSIPNLEPGREGPVVGLRARSLLPYCHFQLEDSDYIHSGRRNPDLPGPCGSSALDPSTRAIEFMSTGVGVSCSVKFDVINPTNQIYSFAWKCRDELDPKQLPAFICHCTDGVIDSGKKTQVSKHSLTELSVTRIVLKPTICRTYSRLYIVWETIKNIGLKLRSCSLFSRHNIRCFHVTGQLVRKWRKEQKNGMVMLKCFVKKELPSQGYRTSTAIWESHSVTCHPTQVNAPHLNHGQ